MGRYRRNSYHNFYFEPRKKINVESFKKGRQDLDPVVIEGRNIADTFWGKRWCDHFENMADYANRLPRGRTYVRQGTVVHLEIKPGQVLANVAGSDIYSINMAVEPLPPKRWELIKSKCQGSVSTIMDLLMGKFSAEVMNVVCDPWEGLFPTQAEIKYDCSCPDWASLCKHVAATFYAIGNRLDRSPELLFLLRQVNPQELLTSGAAALMDEPAASEDTLEGDLSSIFGIDLFSDAPVIEAAGAPITVRPAAKAAQPAPAHSDLAPKAPGRPPAKVGSPKAAPEPTKAAPIAAKAETKAKTAPPKGDKPRKTGTSAYSMKKDTIIQMNTQKPLKGSLNALTGSSSPSPSPKGRMKNQPVASPKPMAAKPVLPSKGRPPLKVATKNQPAADPKPMAALPSRGGKGPNGGIKTQPSAGPKPKAASAKIVLPTGDRKPLRPPGTASDPIPPTAPASGNDSAPPILTRDFIRELLRQTRS
ncbi:MAG: SWIM zinc finger family protein [Deltaproteobacteria bacterium]|jgi:uncharacterized Zn finger protein|nr:SWIM zinc finger family protein [Deltaproteobacteria bacterium]